VQYDARGARRYDRIAAIGNLALGGDARIDRVVLRQLSLAPGMRVLDVGAGTGRLAPRIGAGIEPLGRLVLVDASDVMLEQARRLGRLGDGAVSQIGVATELPFADRSFDRVLLSWVLHELPEAEQSQALSEALRVLKPGGLVVVLDHGRPTSPAGRLWWKLVKRGLASPDERQSLAFYLEHPADEVLQRLGLQVRRHLRLVGGLVRVVVGVRPG
jgi:ubiquinone/menaquinone biosynthesis C-methylase UbiE